jgi:8-oxo-dGTP pyrophosphatase MutT (NUDIX family)
MLYIRAGAVEDGDLSAGMDAYLDYGERGAPDTIGAQRGEGTAIGLKGLLVAAVRETFEETGVLFARTRTGELLRMDKENVRRKLLDYRNSLLDEMITFEEMLNRESLFVAADRLNFFTRWITPPISPIRYDAHFFIACMPAYQRVEHDGRELVCHVWLSPSEALRRYESGEMKMVLPTVETLRSVSMCASMEEAIQTLPRNATADSPFSG